MKRIVLALLAGALLAGGVYAQNAPIHRIIVNGSGTVLARPDLGILTLVIRSSAPLAADGATEITKKAKDVQTALSALGYPPGRFKLASVTFSRAGGPYYGPNQPSFSGIEASRLVYVFFEGPELSHPGQMSAKMAAVIDALGKAGAVPNNTPGPYPPQQQSALIVYTVKDPAAYESQALQQAIDHARTSAQAIAKQMQVQITGLSFVNTGFNTGFTGPYMQQAASPLADLPYRYYSMNSDEVEITARATLNYDFK